MLKWTWIRICFRIWLRIEKNCWLWIRIRKKWTRITALITASFFIYQCITGRRHNYPFSAGPIQVRSGASRRRPPWPTCWRRQTSTTTCVSSTRRWPSPSSPPARPTPQQVIRIGGGWRSQSRHFEAELLERHLCYKIFFTVLWIQIHYIWIRIRIWTPGNVINLEKTVTKNIFLSKIFFKTTQKIAL